MTNELKTFHRILFYPWLTFGLVVFFANFVQKIIHGTLFAEGLWGEIDFIPYFILLVFYQIYFFKAVGYKRRQ